MDLRNNIEREGRDVLARYTERIGVCEDHGWWFTVAPGMTEQAARCPDPSCTAEVMLIGKAPVFEPALLLDHKTKIDFDPSALAEYEHRMRRQMDNYLKDGIFQWGEEAIGAPA